VNDRDLDAEFERIVAGWDAEAPDPQTDASAPDALGESSEPANPGSTSHRTEATGPADPKTPSPAGLARPVDAPDPVPPSPPTPGVIKSAGLNLPIAPATPHAWRGAEPPVDDVDELLESSEGEEDHFTPPTEMDLPTAEEDPMFWAIVGGLGGGPLLLLYILFFDRGGSGWWIATAIAMIVVGFVLLVLRGGTERDPFDDGTRV
jgi:hypothetical protein